MKFYDENYNLIWESVTTKIPYNYFTADNGSFILSTGIEKSYIKDFGNINPFYNIPAGTNETITLQNGSKIFVRRQGVSPESVVLNLFTKWDVPYPLNGRFVVSIINIGGQDYFHQNIFWQPDGAGASIIGTIEARINPSTLIIESYYVSYQKVSAWNEELIQTHIDFFMGTNNSDDDVSEATGGNGNYDLTTTSDVDFPTLPNFSLLDSNMIHGYALNTAQCHDLSAWFWDENIWTNFKKLFNNPVEAVISFGILPIETQHTQTAHYLKIGTATSDTAQGFPLTSEWRVKDFGTFYLNETWGSFIDYTSTQISIYLPYIGVKELNINECMSSELHLKYFINCITGDCIAILKISKNSDGKNIADVNSCLYQFNGNMLVQCPLTASDFSSRISSVIASAGSIIGSTIATVASEGALAPMLAGALVSAGSSMLTSSKANIIKTGNINGINGYMSIQYPFLILDRPSQNIPADFNRFKGKASIITAPLKQMIGYTEIATCILDNIPCTDDERSEIDNLLKTGVIV